MCFSNTFIRYTARSYIRPHFFQYLLNPLFLFIKDVELENLAHDNTIYAARNSIEELIKTLGKESKSAIDWFKMNDMIVNPDKFQAMIMSRDKKENKHDLYINNSIISSADSVTLLGNELDNTLNFEKHV